VTFSAWGSVMMYRQLKTGFIPAALILLGLLVIGLTGCSAAVPTPQPTSSAAPAAASTPTQVSPAPTQAVINPTSVVTQVAPTNQIENQNPTSIPIPTEARLVELEWPAELRLGESDVVRLSLVPSQDGYVVNAEFSEHPVQSQPVTVARPQGYEIVGVARLDGAGFDLEPQGEQVQDLVPGQTILWRWSLTAHNAGRQRLALVVKLRWNPLQAGLAAHEAVIYSRALTVKVTSILGLTGAQAQAAGVILAVLAGVLLLGLVLARKTSPFQALRPNPAVTIETLPGSPLPGAVSALFQALFARYNRLIVTAEFHSGYSGSRTWLVLPVHADGRRDAQTIVKAGPAPSIQTEFNHYQTFVKDTLPPVTARIQQAPVRLRGGQLAALRYTFIGQSTPTSLREALLADPDPAYLERLFETFGPNWWMQRRPATFRLALEYDHILPAHLVLEPCASGSFELDGATPPAELGLKVGDSVGLRHFPQRELRADGRSLSLEGRPAPGQPPLRVRWMDTRFTPRSFGRVTATRSSLLRDSTAGLALLGLPDPLLRLPAWLDATINGSQSIIHGDLNLENILIGPGGLVWLIDFARTRLGHPLVDFSHLEGEIIAHILASAYPSAEDYLSALRADRIPLLASLHGIAARCLANPSQPDEYWLALAVTCLGMLKYPNLDAHARHLLYLSAAWVGSLIN
jgi:hypothetical protein